MNTVFDPVIHVSLSMALHLHTAAVIYILTHSADLPVGLLIIYEETCH